MVRKKLNDLIKLGILKEGQYFVFQIKGLNGEYNVRLTKTGKLESLNGKIFSTPTSAAKSYNGGKSVNGWRVWRSVDSGETLFEIWSKSNDRN